ncbi:MAG: hypothetical protein C0490_17050, partial [Marivirga sp.]|nr:hypothetical protein [Marivirga sp.]
FQFSLFPGISTNGIGSGSYYNSFSLNIFGGLSAGNRVLELGFITNSNFKTTTGIQIAGLANIVGTNAFINLTLSEERTLINTEDFEVNRKGIQLAGFLNYVLNHATGIQLSGGFNVVGNNFKGFQLAGIGNSAGENMIGVQLGGLYNLAKESVGGFQISAAFNYTDAQLSGMQLGLVNKARSIKGKKSTPPTRSRGWQIGLINASKEMDGLQVGLINFGGDMRGKQIGLINFFSKYPSKERVRMGTPIGLLNFGSKGSYWRVSYNEIYSTNIEYTTGNCLNCSWVIGSEMPFDDDNQIYNQNALILGYDPFQETWGFGYGFQKVLYNKFSMRPSPLNKKRVISYGARFLHLNRSMSFDDSFNLLTRLNVDFGKRWRFLYVFAGVSVNYFLSEVEDSEEVYKIRTARMAAGKMGALNGEIWPGYVIGIQF